MRSLVELELVVRQVCERQDGVVARRQLLASGLAPHDLDRLVRRRVLTPLCRGVLLDHSGLPAPRQRAWAACLALWPAALAGPSAMAAAAGAWSDLGEVVHVVIAGDRSSPASLPGVRVRRSQSMDEDVHWGYGPPRQRYEEALLDVVRAARDELTAVSVIATACGSRITTAERLRTALARRPRFPGRRWTTQVLDDTAEGTCSVLEHGYLTQVERPHGLPRAARQRGERGRAGMVYRDVSYAGGAEVELDGRLGHSSVHDRDADLDRDLDVAAEGGATVRLGYGQVFRRPCRTAVGVVAFLRARGVAVAPYPCSPGCPVAL